MSVRHLGHGGIRPLYLLTTTLLGANQSPGGEGAMDFFFVSFLDVFGGGVCFFN